MIVDMDPTIIAVSVADGSIRVSLRDGRQVSAPVRWFPRLEAATPTQREQVEIDPAGTALHWPELDEDIDVSAFLAKEHIATSPIASLLVSDDGSLAETARRGRP